MSHIDENQFPFSLAKFLFILSISISVTDSLICEAIVHLFIYFFDMFMLRL